MKRKQDRPTAGHCPKNEDGKHRDAGGMFFFACRDCGWSEEYPGDSDAGYPDLRGTSKERA